MLRGRVQRARAALDEACRYVYASQNRRHIVILAFRYAHLMTTQGDFLAALNLLQNIANQERDVLDRTTWTAIEREAFQLRGKTLGLGLASYLS